MPRLSERLRSNAPKQSERYRRNAPNIIPDPVGEKRIDLEIQTIHPAFDAWVLYR